MPTYKIRGIDVDFPFEAYDCQLDYMEKVIEALQRVYLLKFCIFFSSVIKILFVFISELNSMNSDYMSHFTSFF